MRLVVKHLGNVILSELIGKDYYIKWTISKDGAYDRVFVVNNKTVRSEHAPRLGLFPVYLGA